MKIVPMAVTLVDSMGNDLSIVNAARVSFDKESELEPVVVDGKWNGQEALSKADIKLISYLATHNHWSPFSHAFASFRIKAPLFVARQLGKHQVGLAWNEVSRRYVDSEPEFFVPRKWRRKPAGNIKQGSSDSVFDDIELVWHLDEARACSLEGATVTCLKTYNAMLKAGVAPEMARMVLPQAVMTEWIWSGSLYAFTRVCKLRLDAHAQKECQEVAKMIEAEMKKLFPVSWEALMKEPK